MQHSQDLCRERVSVNSVFLYEVLRAGIHVHMRERDEFSSVLKLIPVCAV